MDRAGRAESWEKDSIAPGRWASAKVEIFAAHVEVESLVEALATKISTKLESVVTEHLGEVVRPLKRISDLWKLAFGVVPKSEAAEKSG